MKVVFEITGLSCDLALHPISPQTAESMREGGRDIYSQKYMNWWRRGNTRTFGMRLNESSEIRLQVDGEDVSFNANLLYRNVYTLRQRMYLSSKAQFLAVLGYDNETCTFRWIWEKHRPFRCVQVQLCRDGLGQRPRHQGLPRARQRVLQRQARRR